MTDRDDETIIPEVVMHAQSRPVTVRRPRVTAPVRDVDAAWRVIVRHVNGHPSCRCEGIQRAMVVVAEALAEYEERRVKA